MKGLPQWQKQLKHSYCKESLIGLFYVMKMGDDLSGFVAELLTVIFRTAKK